MAAVIAAISFVTIVLAFAGAYDLYSLRVYGDSTRTRKRLRAESRPALAGAVEIIRKDTFEEASLFSSLTARITVVKNLKTLLKQANSEMPVGVFLMISAVLALGGLLIAAYLSLGYVGMIAGALGGGALPLFYQIRRKRQRLARLEQQLPDALDLIARTLLAGHAFIMGLKMVGEQLEEPVSGEFKKTFDEINFGVSVQDSMKGLSERVDSLDIKFFVTSLLVQLETGGNLAEIIQSISRLIRARFELFGKVRALSAEGRISAVIMFSLPFCIGLALYFINDEYLMLLFTDELGRAMAMGGVIMMAVGMFVTKRMVKIKV